MKKRYLEQQRLTLSLFDTTLLTAPTGWGKTDAALMNFINIDVNKVFFLFPTITAINKFYSKLSPVFGNSVDRYFYLYEYEIFSSSDSDSNSNNSTNVSLSLFSASHFLNSVILSTYIHTYIKKRLGYAIALNLDFYVLYVRPDLTGYILKNAQTPGAQALCLSDLEKIKTIQSNKV
jgi:CRISPR/Cas system-associated endonuclease/helicase Cas3